MMPWPRYLRPVSAAPIDQHAPSAEPAPEKPPFAETAAAVAAAAARLKHPPPPDPAAEGARIAAALGHHGGAVVRYLRLVEHHALAACRPTLPDDLRKGGGL